jgi:hypothetical protein
MVNNGKISISIADGRLRPETTSAKLFDSSRSIDVCHLSSTV